MIPLGPERSLIRASFYGPRDVSKEVRELQKLNLSLNGLVNDEDRDLCERVQFGLKTTGYEPGPLAVEESGVYHFHRLVRELVPVAALREQPRTGQVAAENERLRKGS